jgi:hypothetical protein
MNLMKDFILQVEEKIKNSKNKYGRSMEIAYYPSSYNGRKISFGFVTSNHSVLNNMYRDLYDSGKTKEFLDKLDEVIKVHKKGISSINSFYF